nr:hypothetical protein Clen_209 [Cedratvirus lena]
MQVIFDLRMVCFEFNSYFVGKGAYINSSYANRYYNYLVKKEKYVEIENLINRGLLDLSHSSNKKQALHICKEECPCFEDPNFSQAINRMEVKTK